jgi:hypothetical protein
MRISQKREDWGLYDFSEGQSLYDDVDASRDLLVAAMTAPDDVTAAKQADEALAAGLKVGEAIGAFHADVFLKRRRSAGQISRRPMGCRLDLSQCFPDEAKGAVIPPPFGTKLAEAFDFLTIPFSGAPANRAKDASRPAPPECAAPRNGCTPGAPVPLRVERPAQLAQSRPEGIRAPA